LILKFIFRKEVKTIKGVALRTILLILLIAGVYFVAQDRQEKIIEYIPVENEQVQEVKEKVIERETVMNAIRNEIQLVGLVGDVSKTIIYEDNKWTGKKEYHMQINGTYKLGYNMKEILFQKERVIVDEYEGIVTVAVPDVRIIALELPFDDIKIKEKTGWFRNDITDQQKQEMYKQAKNKIITDIENNTHTIDQAHKQTNQALREIFMKIDGVKKVNFVY